jgi:hypothetical protein
VSYQRLNLLAVAFLRTNNVELFARATAVQWRPTEPLWELRQTFETPQEASETVRLLSVRPRETFGQGRVLGNQQQREGLRDQLPGKFDSLRLISFIDASSEAVDLNDNRVTIGLGQFLVSAVEAGRIFPSEVSEPIGRFLSAAPFASGYWAPFKRLFKLLETRPDCADLFGLALARLDRRLDGFLPYANPGDDLHPFLDMVLPRQSIASQETLAYLTRRGRRALRHMGRATPTHYVRCATSFFRAIDQQGSGGRMEKRWILADILYGRGASHRGHGHGPVTLPSPESRFNRRWDNFPGIWNENLTIVSELWSTIRHTPEVQAWAFNVLRSCRQALPSLNADALRLALLSPSPKVRACACTQVAAEPRKVLDLDVPSAQAYLEFCSNRQFMCVVPALRANHGAKLVQDAVLRYAEEHGLQDISRNAPVGAKTVRDKLLLYFTLRFIRSRLNEVETYQLAHYVGQTTGFKPIDQWGDTLRELPLRTLVELRIHLESISAPAKKIIDQACRLAAELGGQDENLGVALAQSPARDVRALGWGLLTGANSATIFSVWDQLIALAVHADGKQRLIEAMLDPERRATLTGHPSEAQLIARIVGALGTGRRNLVEHLLERLAEIADPRLTIQILDQLLAGAGSWSDATRTRLIFKIFSAHRATRRIVWDHLSTGSFGNVAQLIRANRALLKVLIDEIDPADLSTIDNVQGECLAIDLRTNPSRLVANLGFALAAATCPYPEVHQIALAIIEARDLTPRLFVPLLESGLPAPMAAGERYVRQLRGRQALTSAIVAIADSGVARARAVALTLMSERSAYFDADALFSALAEHRAPEVAAAVANYAEKGGQMRRESLRDFDNRILRSRRIGRIAKDLVKARVSHHPAASVPHESKPPTDERRLETLIAMARGTFRRDREWALQQLTQLVLDGHPILGVSVSVTS